MVEKRGCGGGSNDNDCGGCMAAIVIVECILDGVAARSVCASPQASGHININKT